jgi:hypothetical protein
MELRSLSASSGSLFEDCPARWAAEYAGRADQISSPAADKGTVVHETLQKLVEGGWHLRRLEVERGDLLDLYSDVYERYFADTSEFDDGFDMVLRWWERRDEKYWGEREVLHTEVKKSFPIQIIGHLPAPHVADEIPFNYIFDRVDRLNVSEIEVVDYKTWRLPRTQDELRHSFQCKAYALAAYLEYHAQRIWVTFDMLRHEAVSVCYREEELQEFGGYLERLAGRMLESDGTEERLNKDCKYCVRKLHCTALATNREHGGTLGNLDDVFVAAKLREKIAQRKAGLEALLAEVDGFIINDMKSRDEVEVADEEISVELKLKSRRSIDGQRAADILGPETMRSVGKVNISDVDKLLKSPALTAEQKHELRNAIQTNWSAEPTPTIRRL